MLAAVDLAEAFLLKQCAHIPLWLDVCASADVVLCGEDKFIVEHPLGLVIQDRRWVQLDHLVVFDCEVMACAFQMSHLKNETRLVTRGSSI